MSKSPKSSAQHGWELFLNGLQHNDRFIAEVGLRVMARAIEERPHP